jgi:hypothetical protein
MLKIILLLFPFFCFAQQKETYNFLPPLSKPKVFLKKQEVAWLHLGTNTSPDYNPSAIKFKDNDDEDSFAESIDSECFGILIYNGNSPDFREYVCGQLKKPLEPNKSYTVSFEITNGVQPKGRYGVNKFGIGLTTEMPVQNNFLTLPYQPQQLIEKEVPFSEKWEKISFDYTPMQPINFITLGNFDATDKNYAVKNTKGKQPYAYYFIKNITIVAKEDSMKKFAIDNVIVNCDRNKKKSTTKGNVYVEKINFAVNLKEACPEATKNVFIELYKESNLVLTSETFAFIQSETKKNTSKVLERELAVGLYKVILKDATKNTLYETTYQLEGFDSEPPPTPSIVKRVIISYNKDGLSKDIKRIKINSLSFTIELQEKQTMNVIVELHKNRKKILTSNVAVFKNTDIATPDALTNESSDLAKYPNGLEMGDYQVIVKKTSLDKEPVIIYDSTHPIKEKPNLLSSITASIPPEAYIKPNYTDGINVKIEYIKLDIKMDTIITQKEKAYYYDIFVFTKEGSKAVYENRIPIAMETSSKIENLYLPLKTLPIGKVRIRVQHELDPRKDTDFKEIILEVKQIDTFKLKIKELGLPVHKDSIFQLKFKIEHTDGYKFIQDVYTDVELLQDDSSVPIEATVILDRNGVPLGKVEKSTCVKLSKSKHEHFFSINVKKSSFNPKNSFKLKLKNSNLYQITTE